VTSLRVLKALMLPNVKVACTTLPRLHADMRTEGEGVAETGWLYTRLVLHPRQLAILNTPQAPLVFLTGPPGCGKSLTLLMKGLHWLGQGQRVLVVSTASGILAASHLIYNQLLQTVGPAAAAAGAGQVHIHAFYLYGAKTKKINSVVAKLLAAAQHGQLFLIVDEYSQ
jgi:hypothetical protein